MHYRKGGMKLILRYVNKVFPRVDGELTHWKNVCSKAEDEMLSSQALSSLKFKRFHAQGGSVYSLYSNAKPASAVKFIVALQTISDYLDNLCDRAGVYDEKAFLQLHASMLDAVDPQRDLNDYYLHYPYKKDGDYLKSLVEACRNNIGNLPSYPLVVDTIKKYVTLYSEMQSYKHLSIETREIRLKYWAEKYLYRYPEISWWEFSAAAGSTLGIFLLYSAASDPLLTRREVSAMDEAYFPWVCGLHILLDYYIDSQEDLLGGDLNFTYYYENLKQCEERISLFLKKSLEHCRQLEYPEFHTTIIKGLLSMYLSDPKASSELNKIASRKLLKRGGLDTRFYYSLCKILRAVGTI